MRRIGCNRSLHRPSDLFAWSRRRPDFGVAPHLVIFRSFVLMSIGLELARFAGVADVFACAMCPAVRGGGWISARCVGCRKILAASFF